MVIHTDIKPFIVAGFVLVLINSNDGHPLLPREKDQDSGSQGRTALLRKSCTDSDGNTGICMFKWDCISRQGIALTTCVDGFLFGACCSLSEDLQEKFIYDKEFKSTTYKEQTESSTEPLIEYVTINDMKKKTNIFSYQEEDLAETSSLLKASSEFSEVTVNDLTTNSSDAFSLKESSVNISISDSNDNNSNVKDIENLATASNQSDESNRNVSIIDDTIVDYNTTNANYIINEATAENNSNNNSIVSNLDSDSVLDDVEKLEEGLNNVTLLNIRKHFISDLTNNENLVAYFNESKEFDENMVTSSISSESGTSVSKFVSDEIFQSTQENFVDLNAFNIDTERTVLESENKDSSSTINNTSLIEQKNEMGNASLVVVLNKDNKTSVTKNIVPSVWYNYTHILPSGLQSIILQLTSREASFSKPSVDPTIQSDLTSMKYNTSNIGEFETFIQNSLADNLKLSLNISDLLIDKMNNSTINYFNNFQSHQPSGNEQNENHLFEEAINSKLEYIQEQNTSLNFINNNSYISTSKITTAVNEENPVGISENNELSSDIMFDSKIQNSVDESNYVLNTNTPEIPELVCNGENKLNKYCKKDTNSENTTYDNSTNSSDNKVPDITQTTQNLDFITDLFNFNTISDETHKNENNKELTSISFQNDKLYVYNQLTSSTENYLKTTDDATDEDIKNIVDTKNDFEDGAQISLETDKISEYDINDSLGNASDNEEFLFDITTDILTYFIKPDHDLSETVLSNFFSTTSGQSFPPQYTEENSFPPSHSHTLQTYDSSFQYTLNETLDDLSSNYTLNTNNSSFSQNSSSTLSSSFNLSSTDISVPTTAGSVQTEYDINENIAVKNLTFNNISSTDYYLHETTNMYEPKLNFSESILNDMNLSTITSSESNQFDFMNVTEITLAFVSDTQDENASLNNTKNETLSHIQNSSGSYNETSTISYVNNSFHTTQNTLLTGTSDHQTTVENVNISNNTEFLHNVLNMTNIELYSLASNSSYPQASTENVTVTETTSSFTPKKPIKNNPWNYKKDCGVRPMQPVGRIVGGRNSHFGKWPWQALVKEATWLGLFVKNKCGGVLITSKYVLTAAHCQPGFLASLLVVLGTHDLSNLNDNTFPIIRNVKRMVVHRHYNQQTFENDLALLEMDTELEFMPHIVPICLPHRNEDFTGEMAFVTGWGKLTHGGDVPNILQEVEVPIVANSDCQMMFYQAGHKKAIQNNFVCAGYTNGGQDSCEGDSGGPLMVQRSDKRWVLVGTVSHGIGCADPNLPGVYMRMSSYRPWIDSIVNK